MQVAEKKLLQAEREGVWRKFIRLIRKTNVPWALIFLTVGLSLLGSRIGVILPDFQRRITGGDLSLPTLLTVLAIMGGLVTLNAVNDWLNGYTRHTITKRMIDRLWTKILHLPLATYQTIQPKELISRTTTDTATLSAVFITVISSILSNTYALYLSLGYVFSYHKTLGYLLLFMIPLIMLEKLLEGHFSYTFAFNQQLYLASLTEYLSQVLINIPLVKVFVKEKHEEERGNKEIEAYNKARFKLNLLGIVFSGTDSALTSLNSILAVLIGGALVAKGELDTGTWIAFFMYSTSVNASILLITQMWPVLKEAQGSIERVTEIMDFATEEYEGEAVPKEPKNIRFENVSFAYGDHQVLHQLNLTIEEGSFTAVVGASGAGKSSFLGLLERFFTPQEGRITYGGQDLESFDLKAWREGFAYVTQEINVFSGTFREALSYGLKPIPEDERLLEAAEAAGLLPLLEAQEGGLDSLIQEGGASLSGGERQRFALARLLLSDAPRLLLDEATSNLDSASQYRVLQSLARLAKGRTTVCVAHRLSTVQHADKILVLDQGRLVGQGTHEELLEHCQVYQTLVQYELVPDAGEEAAE